MTVVSAKNKLLSQFSSDRLHELAEKLGGGGEIARRAHISPSLVSRYMRGSHEPSFSNLAAIAQGCGVSLDWLVFGRGSLSVGINNQVQAAIPFYQQEASAGPGVFADDTSCAEQMLALPTALINKPNRAATDSLFAIQAKGDSMEPTIRNGSLLVVERTTPVHTPHEGIHVLGRGDLLFVKRIQPREPGLIRLHSDNSNYEPEDVRFDDPHQNLRILGRVIWVGHSI